MGLRPTICAESPPASQISAAVSLLPPISTVLVAGLPYGAPAASNSAAVTVTFAGLSDAFGERAVHHQRGVVILLVQIGLHFEIAQVLLGRGPEVDVAEDAAHAPHVLIFQVGAVAEAIDFHRQQVAARPSGAA